MKYERILALLKCLLGAYVITGLLLLLTAGLLYKCNLSEKVIDIAIIAIYVISSLLAGLFYSKGAKSRRFLPYFFRSWVWRKPSTRRKQKIGKAHRPISRQIR